MKARLAAAGMIALAAVLYFAAAVPMRREAAAAADAFGRARTERRDALARAGALERRNQARAQAVAAVTGAPADAAMAARAVRGSVSRVLAGSRVRGVHLVIRPGARGVDVTVSARGSVDDVLRLTGELTRPAVGVVLERVQLARGAGEVSLQVVGLGVAAAP
jgi:hypothetical protein